MSLAATPTPPTHASLSGRVGGGGQGEDGAKRVTGRICLFASHAVAVHQPQRQAAAARWRCRVSLTSIAGVEGAVGSGLGSGLGGHFSLQTL